MVEQEAAVGVCADIVQTDPELAGIVSRFASEARQEEAVRLPERTRGLCVAATLLGCQGIDAFRAELPGILDGGVTPLELREVVYQAVDYLGIGRVLPFVGVMNDVFASRGVGLPLEAQGTTSADDRLQKGNQAQVDIFGEGMRGSWEKCPEERAVVNRWLAENCFGDYYTRGGLTLAERELVTFCYLAAQGGCEPQLTAHAGGNLSMGNDKSLLYAVVHQCLPYVGYPRSLNALACVDAAAKAQG